MTTAIRKAIFLLLILVTCASHLSAQKSLSRELPADTWLLQSAFERRLPCAYNGPAEFGVPNTFLSAVAERAEQKSLPLFKDPELSEKWDLAELRKLFLDLYLREVEMETDEFGDWGSEMGPEPEKLSLSELIADGMVSGSAGVVEMITVMPGKITWKREAGYLSWGDWENLDQAFEVYFPVHDGQVPWEKLVFQHNAAGFAEMDAPKSLEFHQFSFYPEKMVPPGGRNWQMLVYNPLPGTTPDLLFSNWEKLAGGTPHALLARHDGRQPGFVPQTKGPYILQVPQQLTASASLDGLVQPKGKVMNESLLKEYVPQLMKKAFEGALPLYSPHNRKFQIQDPLEDYIELEESAEDFDDGWGDDDWGSGLSAEKRREKLEKMDYSVFDAELKVIAHLEKRGDEITLVPEFIEVSCFLPAVDDAPRPFACIKIDDAGSDFGGLPLREFLRSGSCARYPLQIGGQEFNTIAEGYYMGWFLENDWENLPSPAALKKLRKARGFKAKLEEIYR